MNYDYSRASKNWEDGLVSTNQWGSMIVLQKTESVFISATYPLDGLGSKMSWSHSILPDAMGLSREKSLQIMKAELLKLIQEFITNSKYANWDLTRLVWSEDDPGYYSKLDQEQISSFLLDADYEVDIVTGKAVSER